MGNSIQVRCCMGDIVIMVPVTHLINMRRRMGNEVNMGCRVGNVILSLNRTSTSQKSNNRYECRKSLEIHRFGPSEYDLAIASTPLEDSSRLDMTLERAKSVPKECS